MEDTFALDPHPTGISIPEGACHKWELAQQKSCYLLKTHQSYQSVFVPVFLYAVTMLISILKELFQVKNGLTTSLLFFLKMPKISVGQMTLNGQKKRGWPKLNN